MFLFLDESGTDGRKTPYEVLAGVAIPSSKLWSVLQAIDHLEKEHFGVNLHAVDVEFKGNNLLKPKRFKHASQKTAISKDERRGLASTMLAKGATAKWKGLEYKPEGHELTAFAQACIAFVHTLFQVLPKYDVKAFAAVIERRTQRPDDAFLRRDYRYLLERFATHAELSKATGILVFDEVERKQSRRLLDSLHSYCNETVSGYRMSDRVIPSPFFVHSDLTPAVQIADLIAYIINWSWRQPKKMTADTRPELEGLLKKICKMEWVGYPKASTQLPGIKQWRDHGFFYLDRLVDPKPEEPGKKGGQETESPAPMKRQGERSNAPKPPQLMLPLFPDSSTQEPKRIKKSGYQDI